MFTAVYTTSSMSTTAADTTIPPLRIGPYTFASRLLVGTGKYSDNDVMKRALIASGADVITVAVRRAGLDQRGTGDSLLDHIDGHYQLLPNTAGCFTAEDALRTARLGRELGISDMVKLEVLADTQTLLPHPVQTLEATQILADEGFTVLVYTSDDPVLAKELESAGAAAVMPAGAPIGSGQGILNRNSMDIIIERAEVPIIIDAGVGTASDVCFAMELGADGVLLNTGIAHAQDPVAMARAKKHGLEAGYWAANAGRIGKKRYANASSPMEGIIGGTSAEAIAAEGVPGE
ncbi:MAG: thiazole synthase [Planctomycetes bacterium]|nr:thiazole synthase [Planctomycetota bacterium]